MFPVIRSSQLRGENYAPKSLRTKMTEADRDLNAKETYNLIQAGNGKEGCFVYKVLSGDCAACHGNTRP